MRVTNSMVLASTLRDLNGSLSRLQKSQTELSTGRVINKPSDDPTKASMAMSLRNQLRRSEQRDRSLQDARGWLSTADGVIVSGVDLLNRAKELVVQASNTGFNNESAREAYAAEISSLRDEMLALANTKYGDRSLFNGTADARTYDDAGAYQGDTGAVMREVADGNVIQVNLTGPDIFGDAGAPEGDLFVVMDKLVGAIRSGNGDDIATQHDALDAATDRMRQAGGTIGSRAARLDAIEDRSKSDKFALSEALSQIEDADIAEALINVKARENAYTAALTAAAKIIPPSLVDYLR